MTLVEEKHLRKNKIGFCHFGKYYLKPRVQNTMRVTQLFLTLLYIHSIPLIRQISRKIFMRLIPGSPTDCDVWDHNATLTLFQVASNVAYYNLVLNVRTILKPMV